MENGKKNLERLTFFLMGSAVAAGVAFLVSPKSGKENRELLATKAREGRDFLETQFRKGKEFVRKGKEEAVEQATDMASRAREAAREQAEQVRSEGEGPHAPSI